MRSITSVAAGLVFLFHAGPLAAQTAGPPQRVGAPVTQVPVPQPVDVAQAAKIKAARPPANPAAIEQAHKDRINAWTVGLAAGRLEGAPLQFASELARVLDDGDNILLFPGRRPRASCPRASPFLTSGSLSRLGVAGKPQVDAPG